MEAEIKSGTFLAESCGPPTAPTTQKYHFFDVAPQFKLSFSLGLSPQAPY